MSGKTVTLDHHPERGYYWHWGRETFYDGNHAMLFWETEEDAVGWLRENHPELKVAHKPYQQGKLV